MTAPSYCVESMLPPSGTSVAWQGPAVHVS